MVQLACIDASSSASLRSLASSQASSVLERGLLPSEICSFADGISGVLTRHKKPKSKSLRLGGGGSKLDSEVLRHKLLSDADHSIVGMKRRSLVYISGCLWLAVAGMLGKAGIRHMGGLYDIHGVEFLLIAAGIAAGYVKAKFVLAKVVNKEVDRIRTLPEPCGLLELVKPGRIALLAVMGGIAALLKIMSIPSALHGTIDIAVSSALFQGSILFIIHAMDIQTES